MRIGCGKFSSRTKIGLSGGGSEVVLELHLQVQRLLDIHDAERRIEFDNLLWVEASPRESREHLCRDPRLLDVRLARKLAGDDPEGGPWPNEIGAALRRAPRTGERGRPWYRGGVRNAFAERDVQEALKALED